MHINIVLLSNKETTYRNEYLLDGRKRCNRNGEAPSTNPLLQSLKQTL